MAKCKALMGSAVKGLKYYYSVYARFFYKIPLRVNFFEKNKLSSARTRICGHKSELPVIVPVPVHIWFFIAVSITLQYQLNCFNNLIYSCWLFQLHASTLSYPCSSNSNRNTKSCASLLLRIHSSTHSNALV